MGCGANGRDNNVVPIKRKDEDKYKLHNDFRLNEDKKGKDMLKKGTKDLNEIAVTPSQFILKSNQSIHDNYTFKEKLGEGNFNSQPRFLWCCIQSHA